MKMRPLRLVAGAGALAAGTAAGSAAFAVPEAAAQPADAAAPAPAPLTLTDVAGPDLYGAPTTFALTVTNPSKTEAVNQPAVTDVLPAGVAYVAPPPAPAPSLAPTAAAGSAAGAAVAAPAVHAAAAAAVLPAPAAVPAPPGLPTPPPPPLPTVTVNPDGTTTLDWSGLADVAPGGHLSLSFSAQPAVAPAGGAYLPGSTFSDSAMVEAGADPQRAATAAATVAVTTVTVSQSATPLPADSKTGTVLDTIRLDGAPSADSTGVEVDLYLPASVQLGSCPAAVPPTPAPSAPVARPAGPAPAVVPPSVASPVAPPAPPCTLPAASSAGKAAAAADGTPAWPLAPGKAGFVELKWAPGSLAAGADLAFTVPLQVANPTDPTVVAPAVLAVLSASRASQGGAIAMAAITTRAVVGTTPPPPPPPPPPAKPAPLPAPASPGAAATKPAVRAGVPATVTVPAPVVHDAVLETGPAVKPTTTPLSPFSSRSSALAAGAPSGSSATRTPQPAPVIPGRDPFLAPGQVDAPATPATVRTPASGSPVVAVETPATGGSNLAYTGIDAEGMGWLAGGLLTGGAGLVLVARRRTAQSTRSAS